jgi:hypothetical protein
MAAGRARISGRRQLARFTRLLEEVISANLEQRWSSEDASCALSRLRSSRRRFRAASGRPQIVCFGTNDDWRQNGIWAAMKEEADFELYEVPDESRYSRNEELERAIEGQRLLEFVDAKGRENVSTVFFAHSGRHIGSTTLDALRTRGIWTIAMSVDDKHQLSRPVDSTTGVPYQQSLARGVDLYWTSWNGALPYLSAMGANAWFAPPGANPDFHGPLELPRDLDIVFVGARYGIREGIVRYLRSLGFRVAAFGSGWPGGAISYTEMVKVFNRARVVLGASGVGATDRVQHLKGRDFEVPMCGAAYVTSYNPELSRAFQIGKEIVCYASLEQCAEETAMLLADPQRAEALRTEARRRSITEHTWGHRLRALWALFDTGVD